MILTHGANSLTRGNFVEIGGRRYPVVKIGNQLWMAENLDWKWSGLGIGGTGYPSTANAWYYGNDEASYGIDGTYKCGLLYNWPAVDYLNQHLSDLGVPAGWHVPTSTERDAFITEIGGASTSGMKLKAVDGSVTVNWPSGWNGTDDYGFAGLPAGEYYGSFSEINNRTSFWTSSMASEINAYYFELNDQSASVFTSSTDILKALSIRLVKDAT